MAIWEYKIITSGKGGFATPALLESFVNQLGKDEWEIIEFHTHPDNPLAFHGLARRPTQRDWTLEAAAAAAAKAEAEKLRAEFSAKFQGLAPGSAAHHEPEEKPTSLAEEVAAADDGLRQVRDTGRDQDPDAPDEDEEKGGEWDDFDDFDDDLPTFFDAIKPHLRKNQKGPGMSVAVEYLAKRWEQTDADLIGALKECGLTLPEAEETPPDYMEFEGDLYWVNRNNRGQFFLNTREKPRPVFRVVQAQKLDPNDPTAVALAEEAAAELAERQRQQAERAARQAEAEARRAEAQARREAALAAKAEVANAAAVAGDVPAAAETGAGRPEGELLLSRLRPLMRRNRRGPGYSGSVTFLARALKQSDADLVAALVSAGLTMPEKPSDKPAPAEIGGYAYWLNKDGRGGVWINGRERRDGGAGGTSGGPGDATGGVEAAPVDAPGANEAAVSPAADLAIDTPAAAAADDAAGAAPAVEMPGDQEAESAEATAGSEPEGATDEAADGEAEETPPPDGTLLGSLRPFLKGNRRGSGVSGEIGYLERMTGRAEGELAGLLAGEGLTVPADGDAKPVQVEHGDEVFWVSQNAKDGTLWLNGKGARKTSRRGGGRKPKARGAAGERHGGRAETATDAAEPATGPRSEEAVGEPAAPSEAPSAAPVTRHRPVKLPAVERDHGVRDSTPRSGTAAAGCLTKRPAQASFGG